MKKNIVLITLDCVRQDHLGCFGKKDIKTPVIDSLASSGAMVQKAYTHCPITGPSHYTLFTSTLPVTHQLRLNGIEIKKRFPSMAQILSANGYETSAFTGAFVLDSRFGFGRGFDHYDDKMVGGFLERTLLKLFRYSKQWADTAVPKFSRNADRLTSSAIKWLKKRKGDKPFFMWLHYFDAHDHFRLPRLLHYYYYRRRDYKASIEYIDRNLGKLLKHLTRTGQIENTVFIVTSDHGEILDEYEYLGKKYRGHAPLAYELTLKVPLIASGPGIKGGKTVKRTFRHIDMLPTVLAIAGIDPSKYEHIEGEDLSRALEGVEGDEKEPYVYAETVHPTTKGQPEWRVMIKGNWKFVLKPQSKEEILYDLEKDPMEKENVIAGNDDKAKELREALLEVIKNDKVIMDESQNPEVRKALEALGYM